MVELGDTCLIIHSEHHECHLWQGAIACVDIVPEILSIAWTVKSGLGSGGVGGAVGLEDTCLRTHSELGSGGISDDMNIAVDKLSQTWHQNHHTLL